MTPAFRTSLPGRQVAFPCEEGGEVPSRGGHCGTEALKSRPSGRGFRGPHLGGRASVSTCVYVCVHVRVRVCVPMRVGVAAGGASRLCTLGHCQGVTRAGDEGHRSWTWDWLSCLRETSQSGLARGEARGAQASYHPREAGAKAAWRLGSQGGGRVLERKHSRWWGTAQAANGQEVCFQGPVVCSCCLGNQLPRDHGNLVAQTTAAGARRPSLGCNPAWVWSLRPGG